MNRLQFRELVTSLVRFSGQAYLEDTADINTLISERVRAFSIHTLCLYNPVVSFAVSANIATYDIRDLTYFGSEMVKVQKVTLNKRPLYNFQGVQGPTSLDELSYNYPSYLTDTTGTPVRFAQIPPHSIRLYPKPDANGVANETSVAGWTIHSSLSASSVTDSTLLTIPEEYIRTCAYFSATALLLPTADGQSDFEKLNLLNSQVAQDMVELRQKSIQLLEGPTIRGIKKGRHIYSIG